MHVRDDYDNLSLPNTTIDKQHVEATDVDVGKVDDSSKKSSNLVATNAPLPSGPRFLKMKVPSASTRTRFTWFGHKKGKKDV